MSNEIVERPETALQTAQGLMPALSFNQMAVRYNAMQQMAKEIMRKDADYGVIPGTGTKPTLLKPGAEKLCALFGLRPVFAVVREVEDWDRGIFYYWYKCQLHAGDRFVGEGEGSANSKEKKYRWRTVYPEKATDEEKRLGKLETRKGRNGNTFRVYLVENTEPFDLINTLQKMAQKRALVAATLIVTSASDFFTQDVEDMVDVEVRNVPTPDEPEIIPPNRPAEPARPNGNGGGNGSAKRGEFPASALHSRLSSMGLKDEGARHGFAAHALGRDVDSFEALSNDERWRVFDEYKAVQMKEAQAA